MSAIDSLALVGRTIGGHFRVEEVVGDGPFSILYRARHVGPDEPVAVRVLKIGVSADPNPVDAFVRKWRAEASSVAGVVLADPQLVRTIELGTAATGVGTYAPFAASEWLDGRTLDAAIAAEGKPLSLADAVKRIEPAATALAHAHRSGVVHGRLTPKQLFLAKTDDGIQLRVAGIGAWLAIAEAVRAEGTGGKEWPDPKALFISPWSAPEHLDASLGDVGLATDVYGLALVVLEAMAGKTFVAESADAAAIRAAVLAAPRSPKQVGLTLGGHVNAVFERALARDPLERWPDIGVFWGALRGAIADDEAGVPIATWKAEEQDTARARTVPNAMAEITGLTPTGPTDPTGMTPTGTGMTPTGPGDRPPASAPGLPDFDDNPTTEMAPLELTVPMPIVRQPDDEDLTPVRPSGGISSSKTKAARPLAPSPSTAPIDRPRAPLPPPPAPPMEIPIDVDVTQPIPIVTGPPAVANGNARAPGSERRRAAKPGDPPPEVAGTGRATGLKVTVPAPAAKVRVDDLPSVIVEGEADDSITQPESPRGLERAPVVHHSPLGDQSTVVQIEPRPTPPRMPSARPAARPVTPARALSSPPGASAAPPPTVRGRALPPPSPARHYGASSRRAERERRKLVLVGVVVFVAVAVATGLVLGLRGMLVP